LSVVQCGAQIVLRSRAHRRRWRALNSKILLYNEVAVYYHPAMHDPDQTIAELRHFFKSHAKNQRELSVALGVSHSWLNKFLRGKENNPTTARLSALSTWAKNNPNGGHHAR
jgi:hypothetical protein